MEPSFQESLLSEGSERARAVECQRSLPSPGQSLRKGKRKKVPENIDLGFVTLAARSGAAVKQRGSLFLEDRRHLGKSVGPNHNPKSLVPSPKSKSDSWVPSAEFHVPALNPH